MKMRIVHDNLVVWTHTQPQAATRTHQVKFGSRRRSAIITEDLETGAILDFDGDPIAARAFIRRKANKEKTGTRWPALRTPGAT